MQLVSSRFRFSRFILFPSLFSVLFLCCFSHNTHADWPKIPPGDFKTLRVLLRGDGDVEPSVLAYENEITRLRASLITNPRWISDSEMTETALRSIRSWDQYVRETIATYLRRHPATPALKTVLNQVTFPAPNRFEASPPLVRTSFSDFLSRLTLEEKCLLNRPSVTSFIVKTRDFFLQNRLPDPDQFYNNLLMTFRLTTPEGKNIGDSFFQLWEAADTVTKKLEVIGYIELFMTLNSPTHNSEMPNHFLIHMIEKNAFSTPLIHLLAQFDWQQQNSFSWPSSEFFSISHQYPGNEIAELREYISSLNP